MGRGNHCVIALVESYHCMRSIGSCHLVMADCLALEVLYSTTNAFSFGGFQLVNVLHEASRHTVHSRTDVDVEDGVGDLSV